MREPRPHLTEMTDEEWAFVAPYLTLIDAQSPQRTYDLCVMLHTLRWIVRVGAPWRLLPNLCRLGGADYQQTQRCLQAGCLEAIVNGLCSLLV